MRTRPPFLRVGKVILTVNRTLPGSRVNGRYVPGAVVEVEVEANVQPFQRKTGEVSPKEGDRHVYGVKVFSVEPLQPVIEGNPSSVADTFVFDDIEYEVIQVQPWKMGLMNHYECVAVRKERT